MKQPKEIVDEMIVNAYASSIISKKGRNRSTPKRRSKEIVSGVFRRLCEEAGTPFL